MRLTPRGERVIVAIGLLVFLIIVGLAGGSDLNVY